MAKITPSPPEESSDLSPEVRYYLESRGITIPTCPPKIRTPEPSNAPGARFDPARVDRVLKVFSLLRHTQGKWAGLPLVPDPWQVAYILAPVFGWVRRNGDGEWVRIIRRLYVDVSRKNGKTTLAGGIATYLMAADGEQGAQVYAAASAKDQARFCFDPVKTIAEKSPALSPYVKTLQSRVVHKPSGSYFAVVSRVGDAMHGANIHGGIIDELHAHKTPELVEAIETGTGSRTQPLVMIITTPDDGRRETIYARRRDYIEQLARGSITDPTTYGVIWAADVTDNPFDPATWEAANPGYGISPSREYITAAASEAQQSPADLAKFLRLHLGLRTKQLTRFITMDSWDANASIIEEPRLAGREAYGGLDLSSTSDLTALCWLFPDDKRGGYDALWRVWVPEGALLSLDKRTAGAFSRWQRDRFVYVTPGDVVDYDWVKEQIRRDMDAFDVKSIGFDPWNASQLSNDLMAENAPLVKVRQGFATLSSPCKELQRLLLTGSPEVPMLRHGGNPAVRWQVDNLAVAMDPSGNVKPDKSRGADKIDAVSALVTALAEAMVRKPKRISAYETDDLMTV